MASLPIMTVARPRNIAPAHVERLPKVTGRLSNGMPIALLVALLAPFAEAWFDAGGRTGGTGRLFGGSLGFFVHHALAGKEIVR